MSTLIIVDIEVLDSGASGSRGDAEGGTRKDADQCFAASAVRNNERLPLGEYIFPSCANF
jgi:hypothetical protein